MADERYLEVSTVAKKLNVSVDTIYRHRNNPDSPLVFIKCGLKKGYRITKSSFELMTRVMQGAK